MAEGSIAGLESTHLKAEARTEGSQRSVRTLNRSPTT